MKDPDYDDRLADWLSKGPLAAPDDVVERALHETTSYIPVPPPPRPPRRSSGTSVLLGAVGAMVMLTVIGAVAFAAFSVWNAPGPSASPGTSPGAVAGDPSDAPTDVPTGGPAGSLVAPQLALIGQQLRDTADGPEVVIKIAVTNWGDFAAELFGVDGKRIQGCANRARRSRTVAFVRDATTHQNLASFCRLRQPIALSELSFPMRMDHAPAAAVYLELVDTVRNDSTRSIAIGISLAGSPPQSAPPDTASPAPSETAAPTGSPTEPPAPTPTPTPGLPGWDGPLLVSERLYWDPSLVVDAAQHAHAAASLSDGIYYVTNSSGRWLRERVSSTPVGGADRTPSVALDLDGTVWIAFTRYASLDCENGCVPRDPEGTYLSNNSSGEWSEPELVPGAGDESPSLAVVDGIVHLATSRWIEPLGSSAFYTTNAAGSWTETRFHEKSGAASVAVGDDGLARVLFWDAPRVYLATATNQAGDFVIEPVADGYYPFFALDAGANPHVVFHAGEDEVRFTRRDSGGWTAPASIDLGGAMASGVAVSADGIAHVASYYTVSNTGFVYASNSPSEPGTFSVTPVHPALSSGPDGAMSPAAIASDAAGRAHMLFTVFYAGQGEGLWYAVSP